MASENKYLLCTVQRLKRSVRKTVNDTEEENHGDGSIGAGRVRIV